jgi:hypothetical protein
MRYAMVKIYYLYHYYIAAYYVPYSRKGSYILNGKEEII